MPKITVSSDSSLSAEEAFSRVKGFISNDPDLKKLDPSYSCEFNEPHLTGLAKGSKFKADLKAEAQGNGSKVEIIVDLPFMLAPFKGKIQSTLKSKLDQALA